MSEGVDLPHDRPLGVGPRRHWRGQLRGSYGSKRSGVKICARQEAEWMTASPGGPLGNRSFQLLSAGQLASTIGDLCYAVARP